MIFISYLNNRVPKYYKIDTLINVFCRKRTEKDTIITIALTATNTKKYEQPKFTHELETM